MWERKITNPLFSFPTFFFPLAETAVKADRINKVDGIDKESR